MENHYTKNNRVVGGEAWCHKLSPLESILYSFSGSESVLPLSYFITKFNDYCRDNYEETRRFTKNPKDIEFALDNLSKLGFLKKLSGKKLLRSV